MKDRLINAVAWVLISAAMLGIAVAAWAQIR